MDYCFSGKVTLEDFFQLNNFHKKKSFWLKFQYIFYFFIFGYLLKETVFIVKDYIEIYTFKEIITDKYIIYMLLLLVFLLIFFIVLNKIIVPLIYKKNYNSNKFYNELVNFKIDKNEISIITESSSLILTKDKILKIQNDKDSIYIYIALYTVYIIKARYLENVEIFNELKIFLKDNYYKK